MNESKLNTRAEELLEQQERRIAVRTDRMFVGLLSVQWLAALLAALLLSPETWDGDARHIHPHVWLALGMGGLLTLFPIVLVLRRPGTSLSRHVIAIAQVLFSSLLIQVTGGRIETHFHVFGSLAFLAFYRDWTVLVPATIVVAGDHLVRGVFWPQTVFGIATASPWRWVEHAGWVVFEDLFLVFSCIQSRREMWDIARRTAELEQSNADLHGQTQEKELAYRAQQAIFDTALDALVCMDSTGKITAWNAQAEQTFGWTGPEAIGQLLHGLIIPLESRDLHVSGLRRFLETGEGAILNRRVEVTAMHRDGREFPVELAIAPIHQNGGVSFCAFIRDITESKHAAETLRKAKDDAEAASRAKSAFLAHMSHEIRTPLNGVLGYTDLLIKRDHRISSAERADHLRTIADSGRHLLTIIDDVLDLSKIEAGECDATRLLCSPHEVVAGVVSLLRVRAQEKGLQLEYAWDGAVPELVLTDPARLRQLLLNIVGNAIKFTEHGGVTITARVCRGSERASLELRVCDTGIGIPTESVERIFEPFIQADDSITRRFGGTGLGLPISRRIAEILGGALRVESQVGEGSTFIATVDAGTLEGVRMLREPVSDIGRRDPQSTSVEQSLPPCRLLVVEDGASNRRLLTLLLEDAGAEVELAENGQQGIERTLNAASQGRPFDMILMDMQMPVLDGYSATRELRKLGVKTPIYALTAHAMKGDEEECLKAGCSGFLTKPIDATRLLGAIQAELRLSKQAPRRESENSGPKKHERLQDRLQEVVGLFQEEAKQRLEEMRSAAAHKDWDVVARAAHWMKGAGGSVGQGQFTAPAALLERQALDKAGESVSASLEQLQGLIDGLCTEAEETSKVLSEVGSTSAFAQVVETSSALQVVTTPVFENVVTPESLEKSADGTSESVAVVLLVDDEPFNIELVKAILSDATLYRLISTTDPGQALSMVFAERPDMVLLDLNMPKFSGFDILSAIRAISEFRELPIVMFTSSDDRETRLRALELGATDFIAKPIDAAEMLPRVRNSILVKRHFEHLRRHAESLDLQVRLRTAQLERARRNAIYCLARAAEFRDDDTGRHVIRVGKYAGLIAARLGWSADKVALLEEAAQLHDVGKIGVPDAILQKPGMLAPEEFEVMQRHCGYSKRIFECMDDDDLQLVRRHVEIGSSILEVEDSQLLQVASTIALTHHERWDGSGYPLGLAGEDIPLVGRITAVADVFDALSSKRCYKPAFPIDKCFAILEEGRGKHFDPACLDAFFAARDEVIAVQIAHADLG